MNSHILKKTHNNNSRSFGRKSHNRLQRDIIEDMNVYELSFEDWNQIDSDDDMVIDYNYDDNIGIDDDYDSCDFEDVMDDEDDIDMVYPWWNTRNEAEFLCNETNICLWMMKSLQYNIPKENLKTLALLEWLETQGGGYIHCCSMVQLFYQHIYFKNLRKVSFGAMCLCL